MKCQSIQFYNRYTQRLEPESIYGEGWLRWTYGHPIGRLALHAVAKRAAFSRWYGWRMSAPSSRARVAPFVARYGIDMSQFEVPPAGFASFNDFFIRRLKSGARPVDPDPHALVFPADGRHLGLQDISTAPGIHVKGQLLPLDELLGNDALAARYKSGTMLISRLCPVDYHRYHFPVEGVASRPRLIDGPLFSVSPLALRQDIRILARNRRWITSIRSEAWGEVLMLEVGATNVGSATPTFIPDATVRRGDEKGYFSFGGSLTLCLFEPGRVRLADDLLEQSRSGVELYARTGDRAGLRG